MTETEIKRAFAEVPVPTFAELSDVQVDNVEARHYRVLLGRDREAGPIVVGTTAVQYLDGQIDDGDDAPKVWIGDTGFNTDHARQLAAALVSAADELDGLVQR